MKAFDIAGKRTDLGVTQAAFAARLGWHTETLRDIERGRVDVSLEQYNALQGLIDAIRKETDQQKEVNAA